MAYEALKHYSDRNLTFRFVSNIDGTAEQSYLHCGPNGAGHFVKMVHNGIEYGLMAAYAEGLSVLAATSRCTAMPVNLPGLRRNCSSTLPRTRSRRVIASG
jgi:6-phosphogluconate dehydrogenase (decarboxylating)